MRCALSYWWCVYAWLERLDTDRSTKIYTFIFLLYLKVKSLNCFRLLNTDRFAYIASGPRFRFIWFEKKKLKQKMVPKAWLASTWTFRHELTHLFKHKIYIQHETDDKFSLFGSYDKKSFKPFSWRIYIFTLSICSLRRTFDTVEKKLFWIYNRIQWFVVFFCSLKDDHIFVTFVFFLSFHVVKYFYEFLLIRREEANHCFKRCVRILMREMNRKKCIISCCGWYFM